MKASGFWSPAAASRSAFSLPSMPLWPFAHLKCGGALRRRRWKAAALNQVVLGILTQPGSSYVVSECEASDHESGLSNYREV